MPFLQTEFSGRIAANCITRIGGLNSRPQFNRYWHDVDYCHGGEARTTTASEQAIKDFLSVTQRQT